MQTGYANKALAVPGQKLDLTPEEARALRAQEFEAQRARADADPYIVAGRLTPEEAAFVAESEARLERLRIAFDELARDHEAAKELETRASTGVRFAAGDSAVAAKIAAAVALTKRIGADKAAAWAALVLATSEEAELQASLGPAIRRRQADVQRPMNEEGDRQYRAQQARAAAAGAAAAKAKEERMVRLTAEASKPPMARLRARLAGGAK
jgi:hypothetical protein